MNTPDWAPADDSYLSRYATAAPRWLARRLGRSVEEVEEGRRTVKPTTGPAAFTDFGTLAKLLELPSR